MTDEEPSDEMLEELVEKAAARMQEVGQRIGRRIMANSTSPEIALGIVAKAAETIINAAPPERRRRLLQMWIACWLEATPNIH